MLIMNTSFDKENSATHTYLRYNDDISSYTTVTVRTSYNDLFYYKMSNYDS